MTRPISSSRCCSRTRNDGESIGKHPAHASASPQDDIWRALNDAHILAGCRGYGGGDDLISAAVNLARVMSNHDGVVPPTYMSTKNLIGYNGFPTDGFGEMRYFNATEPPDRMPWTSG